MSNHIAYANKMVSEDHFPDATEMVSDTPRTDAKSFYTNGYTLPVCDAEFTRSLERELNAAKLECDLHRNRLASILLSGKIDKHTCGDVQKWYDYYTVELNAANQRIKRLVEAGDTLKAAGYFGGFNDAVDKWIKVKEAKP